MLAIKKPPQAADELLTADEVAKRLNATKAWVWDHASGRRKPELPSIKMGKLVRFRASEVDEFVQRCSRAIERGISLH